MKQIRIFLIAVISVTLLQACDKTGHDVIAPDELGMATHEFEVAAEGGDIEVSYVSNKPGTMSLINQDDAAWVTLGATAFENDGSVKVNVRPNTGFPRRADILFDTQSRKDTVSVLQYGTEEEKFYIAAGSMLVYNGTGEPCSFTTDINVPLDKIGVEIICSEEDWIKDYHLESNAFTFRTDDNPDKDYTRRGVIVLTYTDGWNQKRESRVTVIQARADNNIGSVWTAEELRSKASEAGTTGFTLPEDALVEGYIVSTTEFGQSGQLEQLDIAQGTGVIDYDLNDLTYYLESLDGKYGFRLETESAVTGELNRNSRVCLKIGGAVVKEETGPDDDSPKFYSITGIKVNELTLTASDATNDLPKKEKYISELTDDDIYTFVTLKDCEIPMRKGPFTPLNEGYTKTVSSANYIAKYPMIFRDKQGSSMYLMTNITCTYRRDGNRMPYGSGNISGVIVHEVYRAFNEPAKGNIGRYQLRHMCREDIALDMDVNEVSNILVEFRYQQKPAIGVKTELPGALLATYGKGELSHTYDNGSSIGTHSSNYSFFYLGPCGAKYDGVCDNNCGIILEDGTDYPVLTDAQKSTKNYNYQGKGGYTHSANLSWTSQYWWDSSNDRGYSWIVAFSTEGIASDKVSMQLAMWNNHYSGRAPHYWEVAYSTTTPDCDNTGAWTKVGEFALPDVIYTSDLKEWKSAGTKTLDLPLPLEILGNEHVYIRVTPSNNKAYYYGKSTYDSGTINNKDKGSNYGCTTMDYFAVRYNK